MSSIKKKVQIKENDQGLVVSKYRGRKIVKEYLLKILEIRFSPLFCHLV